MGFQSKYTSVYDREWDQSLVGPMSLPDRFPQDRCYLHHWQKNPNLDDCADDCNQAFLYIEQQ